MSIIRCPDGATLTLNVYLISASEIEVKLSVDGMSGIADMLEKVDVERLVCAYALDKVDAGWRVMTRAEIADYREREEADAS